MQTQQLVFGGRRPALRGRRTVAMLAGLVAEGWIDARARDELSAAYAFLRTIEHRLQMVRDEQTQRLPHRGPTALDRVGAVLRVSPTWRPSRRRCCTMPAGCRPITPCCSRPRRTGGGGGDPRLRRDRGRSRDPGDACGAFGFRDPALAWETVQRLASRPPPGPADRPRPRDPDRAAAGAAAGARRHRRSGRGAAAPSTGPSRGCRPLAELLAILRSHERLRLLFADILGTAPRLADTVGLSPHVLDTVLDADFVTPTTDPAAVRAQYRALVGRAGKP